MPLPEILHEPLTAARSMIGRAYAFDLDLQTRNARAMLSNAQAFVEEDPAINETFEAARRLIAVMGRARSLEKARIAALQAVDALEHSLL